jgi:hypothetical protein
MDKLVIEPDRKGDLHDVFGFEQPLSNPPPAMKVVGEWDRSVELLPGYAVEVEIFGHCGGRHVVDLPWSKPASLQANSQMMFWEREHARPHAVDG